MTILPYFNEDEAFEVMETIARGEDCPMCKAPWMMTSPTTSEMTHTETCTWIAYLDTLPDED